MSIFKNLGFTENKPIDWDLTPALTFTIFESWGSRVRIRSLDDRYYYFYIDNWKKPAKLYLMERGVKYARVLAEIKAPQEMIDNCVVTQGGVGGLDRSYAIDESIKQWLTKHVIDANDDSKVIPVASGLEVEDMTTGLPGPADPLPPITRTILPSDYILITEAELPAIIKKYNFFDSKENPGGNFANQLVDSGDGLTVIDNATGLMWQRGGYEIASIRGMQKKVAEANSQNMAGYANWRLPTIEEILSLFEPAVNHKEIHLHPCFSKAQPFIFLAAERKPGGYWFADLKQGNIFWASGFNPGGFGRFCRTIE